MIKYFSLLFASLWITINVYSQNVGVGTTNPKAAFNVAAGKTVLFGSDTTGGGGKLMWIPSKYAFRAGGIGTISIPPQNFNEDPQAWNSDSIGVFSFAGGYENKAIGLASTGFGAINTLRGAYSSALGYRNKVNGNYALASGTSNQCYGDRSVAFGNNNTVSSTAGFAVGYFNVVGGSANSFAIGDLNTTTDYSTVAIGSGNTCSRPYSVALGSFNLVESFIGTSLGCSTINSSRFCTVVGSNNSTRPEWSPIGWYETDPIFIVGNGQAADMRRNAMTILKNGNMGLGTDTPDALLHGVFDSSPGIPQLLLEESTTDYARITFRNTNPGFWDIAAYCQPILGNSANAQFNFFFGNFGNVLSLKGNGNATLSGTLTQNSDETLKKDILPLQNIMSRLMKINGYSYHWKEEARGNDLQIGFIAQELEQQFPELVATDEKGIKSVAYSNMVPVLLEAIKEQQKQIDELTALVKGK